MLNGFVLTRAARPTDSVTTFWRRRVLKIERFHQTLRRELLDEAGPVR